MEWVACVGMDWGEERNAYSIRDRDGGTSAGTLGSSAEEIHQWVHEVRDRFPSGAIVVAVEQGRGSLIYALMVYDFLALVPINPRASKAYRVSRHLSGASSDPLDAALICEFAFKHLSELRVWRPDDALTRKLRLLAETRRSLVDRRTAFTHVFAATLKEYFPQALQWFGGETSRLLRAFVKRWPTLDELRQASLAEVTTLMREQRCRKAQSAAQKLMEKLPSAIPLTRDSAIVEASVMHAQSLIAILAPLDEQIAKYDQAIAKMWVDHPDRLIFDSLPGAGPVLAPRLAVAFGRDRNRYETANDVQCYSGIAPVIEASGRQHWVHTRRGYPKFLHQTFHEFAEASIPHCTWAKAFYRQQRQRGAGHHQAIRSLAFRWIRILVRLWKSDQPYDEQRYIEALKVKQSPLVSQLAA